MSYKENEVIAKFTKGNNVSDCGEYKIQDLLDMFDETNVTKNGNGEMYDFTVNDCIENDLVTKDLVCTRYSDDWFVHLNKDHHDHDVVLALKTEVVKKSVKKSVKKAVKIEVECSASLDNEMYNESI